MNDEQTVPTWRLDDLEPGQRKEELVTLKTFVTWLDTNGVAVPACWYAHGWMRYRLAAMFAWWIHVSDGKESAAWWGELQNITQSGAWVEARDHGLTHVDAATGARARYGSFDETVMQLCSASEVGTAA